MGGADNVKPISEQAVIPQQPTQERIRNRPHPQNIYTRTITRYPSQWSGDTPSNSWKIDGHDLTIQELILALVKENAAARATASATPQPPQKPTKPSERLNWPPITVIMGGNYVPRYLHEKGNP